MRLGTALAAASATGLMVVAVATSSVSADGTQPAELAFSHGGRIWVMDADGNGRRPLTAGGPSGHRAIRDFGPVWSPDGRWLAFTRAVHLRGDAYRYELRLIDSAGGSGTALTRQQRAADVFATWSPDGQNLAFVRQTFGGSRLMVIGRDGGPVRALVRQRLGIRLQSLAHPAWSPDGRWIAYTRQLLYRRGVFRPSLYLVRPDGSGRRLVARDAGSPAWSPDGRHIAFSSVRDRNGMHAEGSDEAGYDGEIYVMDADGTHLQRLTRSVGNDVSPAWSPDGSAIAYASDRNFPGYFGDDNAELYTIAPDGSCMTWLTNGSPASAEPNWQPNAGSRASPATCGVTDRPPQVDIATGAARRARGYRAHWLGPALGSLLLSGFQVDSTSVFFDYADCSSFETKDCPPTLQINTGSVCSSDPDLETALSPADHLVIERGALTAYSTGGATVLTGTSEVDVSDETFDPFGKTPSRLGPVIAGLRPYGDAIVPARLAPPVLPRRFAQALLRTTAAYRQLGNTRAVAGRLKISSAQVRDRLHIAAALKPLGPLRSVRCPGR